MTIQLEAELPDLVRVEQLAHRDVDHGSVHDQQLRVLVHAESVLRFGNVADGLQEPPETHNTVRTSTSPTPQSEVT